MHDYPSDKLPAFRSSGYQYSQKNSIKSTEFASGRQRLRLVAKTAPQTYNLKATMTASQLAIFEAWLHHTVNYIEPMNMMIATASGCDIKTVRLLDNGFSKQMIDANNYKIEITVQAETQSIMSASDLADALSA